MPMAADGGRWWEANSKPVFVRVAHVCLRNRTKSIGFYLAEALQGMTHDM